MLPLLCTDTDLISADAGLAITSDKLMDILHRLLGNIEVSMGVAEGNVSIFKVAFLGVIISQM